MRRSRRLPICSASKVRVLLIGFGPFPGAPFNPSTVLVKALARRRRPALADILITTHILGTDYAVVDREIPKAVRREAGHRADLRACRAQATPLHRDAGAQRRLGAVPGCERTSADARRYRTRRAGGVARHRAICRFARRARRLPDPSPFVARCREIFVQLRLLAHAGTCPQWPTVGPVHSHSASQVRSAAAAAAQTPADFVSLPYRCRRKTFDRAHRGKPPLTVAVE
jgi:hypothetical protein